MRLKKNSNHLKNHWRLGTSAEYYLDGDDYLDGVEEKSLLLEFPPFQGRLKALREEEESSLDGYLRFDEPVLGELLKSA